MRLRVRAHRQNFIGFGLMFTWDEVGLILGPFQVRLRLSR